MLYTVGAYVMLAIAILLIVLSKPVKAQDGPRMPQNQSVVWVEPRASVTRIYPFLVPLAMREQGGVAQWGSGLGFSYRTSDPGHSFLSSWVQATWRVNYGYPNALEVAWKVNLR